MGKFPVSGHGSAGEITADTDATGDVRSLKQTPPSQNLNGADRLREEASSVLQQQQRRTEQTKPQKDALDAQNEDPLTPNVVSGAKTDLTSNANLPIASASSPGTDAYASHPSEPSAKTSSQPPNAPLSASDSNNAKNNPRVNVDPSSNANVGADSGLGGMPVSATFGNSPHGNPNTQHDIAGGSSTGSTLDQTDPSHQPQHNNAGSIQDAYNTKNSATRDDIGAGNVFANDVANPARIPQQSNDDANSGRQVQPSGHPLGADTTRAGANLFVDTGRTSVRSTHAGPNGSRSAPQMARQTSSPAGHDAYPNSNTFLKANSGQLSPLSIRDYRNRNSKLNPIENPHNRFSNGYASPTNVNSNSKDNRSFNSKNGQRNYIDNNSNNANVVYNRAGNFGDSNRHPFNGGVAGSGHAVSTYE